jgi:hypothetical protein
MLFDRVYKLQVGKKGQTKGVEITKLHITFDISKTAKKNPNSCTVVVWNLQKSTREKFEEPNGRLVLYAGYAEDVGPIMIFQGNVTGASTERDGADIKTTFELADGYRELRDSTISVGYAEGIDSKRMLQDTSKSLGMPLTLPDDAPYRTWQNGFSYYGSSRVLMDKITSATNLEWSVQNGEVQVIEKAGVTTRKGVLISSHSGMVKSPVRVKQAKVQKAGTKTEVIPNAESDSGWKVTTLLMPGINPGDRVILESLSANGIFRVEAITHKGDSHGGDWHSEMTLVDPKKPIGDGKATGKKTLNKKQNPYLEVIEPDMELLTK